MAKASGNTRIVKPYSGSLKQNLSEYNRLLQGGLYNADMSLSPSETSGYMLYSKDRDYDENEIYVAKLLSQNGFNIKLTSEKDVMFATRVDKNGKTFFSDGTVSLYTYEQRTPTLIENTAATSVKQAIMHANTKHSEVALIYDKSGLFHRKDIENGISKYKKEHHVWKKAGAKTIIVISQKGKIYEHLIV